MLSISVVAAASSAETGNDLESQNVCRMEDVAVRQDAKRHDIKVYWQCRLWLRRVVVAGVFVTAGGTSKLYQRLKWKIF